MAESTKKRGEVIALLDRLRIRLGTEKIIGIDGAVYTIEARRWTSAKRRENPARYFIDGERASADTIVGMVAYNADTLLSSGRVVLREQTLRAAIARTEAA